MLKALMAALFVGVAFLFLAPEAEAVDQVVAHGYSIECNQKDSARGACFLPRYGKDYYYDTGKYAQVISFAKGGQQAARLRYGLETYRSFYAPYHKAAEVLVLDMGAGDYLKDVGPGIQYGGCDDACVDAKVEAFKADYDASFDILYADKGPNTKMLSISMYQFYVEEDKLSDSDKDGESNFEEGRRFYQAVNEHIKAKAAMNGVEVVNLYEAFNGPTGRETSPLKLGYVSQDHIHPNPAGAWKIAQLARVH